jgi:hypothetical protein
MKNKTFAQLVSEQPACAVVAMTMHGRKKQRLYRNHDDANGINDDVRENT